MNATPELHRSIRQVLRTLGKVADLDPRARRTAARRPVNVRVVFDGHEAWALNISAGGMRLVCDADLEVGDILLLRIEPEDGEGSGLMGHGRVVWAKDCPDGHVLGIEFTEPH